MMSFEKFEIELKEVLKGKRVYCKDWGRVLTNEELYKEYEIWCNTSEIKMVAQFIDIILDRNSNCMLVS